MSDSNEAVKAVQMQHSRSRIVELVLVDGRDAPSKR